MQIPLQVTFHGVAASESLRTAIERHAQRLEHFAGSIISCHVVVEPSEKHHRQGNRFGVRVRVTVPGQELEAGRTPKGDSTHDDPYVALRDAFDAMRRQLEDYERKRRGDVKMHAETPLGRIATLFPAMDYGVIVTADGREIRFHRNSLVHADMDRLSEGLAVRFVEQPGEDGPWASTVQLVHPHRQSA